MFVLTLLILAVSGIRTKSEKSTSIFPFLKPKRKQFLCKNNVKGIFSNESICNIITLRYVTFNLFSISSIKSILNNCSFIKIWQSYLLLGVGAEDFKTASFSLISLSSFASCSFWTSQPLFLSALNI